MKVFFNFLLAFVIQITNIFAQTSPSNAYFFEEFKPGIVYYSDGRISSGTLNYNYVLAEMQFLQDEQILSLKYSSSIIFVKIDKITFVPLLNERTYAELLIDGQVVLLHEKRLVQDKSIDDGTYGTSEAVSSIQRLSSLDPSSVGLSPQTTNLPTIDNTLLNDRFFLMKDKKPIIASKRSFNKYFPDKKNEIKEYLKKRPSFSFKEKQDLIDLMLFLLQ